MADLDLSIIQDPLDSLTMAFGDKLLQVGQEELYAIAGVILIIYVIKHGIFGGLVQFLFQFGVKFVIANNLLKYYYTPFYGGYSVHQIFPAFATYLAKQIDAGRMDVLFSYLNTVLLNTQKAGASDWAMIPISWMVEANIWVMEAIAFGSIALSYICLGVMNLVGPIFIPWLIVPVLAYLFWNWMQSIWQYSFYRVFAAALCFVAAQVWTVFVSNIIHGNYTLAHFSVILGPMIAINVGLVWSLLRISTMVSDVFKGTSSAGSNFLGAITSGARGVFH